MKHQDNIFNGIDDSNKPKAFNSQVTFASSSHEITRAEREQAEQRKSAIIQKVRDAIRNK